MEKTGESKYEVEVKRTPDGYAKWEGAIWPKGADRDRTFSIPLTWVWGRSRDSVLRQAASWVKKAEEVAAAEAAVEVVSL